ncbi:hypothetical protein H4J45_18400 [Colwellia sp. BRX10-6]|uniref:hypothetical protein n=1 Tax=unclassified Colwellia TaxID=196834 RepID=UPI0015F661A3|nr:MULTISPECIES: hypothetical protein [unclassified Colwellia]MBA6252059.1 hypothetical protein [Colwellia sp. MB3u-55]MBA6385196.1 hypothetical protein [Colwellia sp. BRX10-9]MBA6396052.1 hypothetical protein [Colwellia sp. BRX10-6]
MDSLVAEIIDLITLDTISITDKEYLIRLVGELLGSKKDWFICLQQNIVLPQEVASGIMGHIFTIDNGRFSNGTVVNFNCESKLANLLMSST